MCFDSAGFFGTELSLELPFRLTESYVELWDKQWDNRIMAKLTAKKVESVRAVGLHGDGDGLYLRVGPTGGKSWILRTRVFGKPRDFGLGGTRVVSLAEAREKARELRKIARDGGDPATHRKRVDITFAEAARRAHESRKLGWRSTRHGENWFSSLERYAFPAIGQRPISGLTPRDIHEVLTPIWSTIPDTSKRVKQRLSTVFDWAKGAGHYPHANPVNGMKKALPAIRHAVVHMEALPWKELPGFMDALRQRQGLSARALEFVILTATRSGEVRAAQWAEISGSVWTISAERTKTAKEHRVPLCSHAVALLDQLRGLNGEFIFPSPSRGPLGARPMSDTVFKALMLRMGYPDVTTHGFRSTFRDWCSEYAHASVDVAETALAHAIGTRVARAYARSDLFEDRRVLMQQWDDFASGKVGQDAGTGGETLGGK